MAPWCNTLQMHLKHKRFSVHEWEETQTPGRVTSARVSGIITQDMPNQISEMYLKVVFLKF